MGKRQNHKQKIKTPKEICHNYEFAMRPEDYQPSGTSNFTWGFRANSYNRWTNFAIESIEYPHQKIINTYCGDDISTTNEEKIIHITRSINIIKRFLKQVVLQMGIIRALKIEMLTELIFLPPHGSFHGGIQYQKALENFESLLWKVKKAHI